MKPTIKAEVGAFQVVLPNIHYKKIEEKLLVDNSTNKNIKKYDSIIKEVKFNKIFGGEAWKKIKFYMGFY